MLVTHCECFSIWFLKGQRLPYRNNAKIAEICNLWTFWSAIQPISHLFKIWQKVFLPNAPLAKKAFCRILKRWFIWSSWIIGQNILRLQIFAILASFLYGIWYLKGVLDKKAGKKYWAAIYMEKFEPPVAQENKKLMNSISCILER